jgi:hypothetical protein
MVAYFALLALSCNYWLTSGSLFMTVATRTAALLAAFAVAVYGVTIGFYLLYPNYFDHLQPSVASISWLWMQGRELYPNWRTDDAYGLVYGPIIFL